MILKPVLIAVAAAIHLTEGHYTFTRLRHNGGEWKEPFQYIRNKTDMFKEEIPVPDSNYYERTFHSPTYYAEAKDSMRCGRDNMAWAATTDVLTVQAGDSMEIVINTADNPWDPQNYDCPGDLGSCRSDATKPEGKGPSYFNHDGPVFVHLSKVPEGQDIHEYNGSGEWVKIYTLGLEMRYEQYPETPVHWNARNSDNPSFLIDPGNPPRIVFAIPSQTPPGDYLMRMSQIWPRWDGTATQHYPSCAHIRVESESTGELPRGILIPEDLSPNSTGVTVSQDMFFLKKLDSDYVYGLGLLWDGENLIEDKPTP